MPSTLRRPHLVIAAWIDKRERDIAAAKRDRTIWGTAFQPKPFTELERRQQRILDTLFKASEKLGYKVMGQERHGVWLQIGADKVEFTLRERIRQFRRPLTDKEKAEWYHSNQKWRQEKQPTGELIFTIKTHLGAGVTQEWRDGERPLEEQIGEIIAVLTIAGPILEKKRKEAEEAERRRREEEERRRQEREKRQQDRNRWRRFLELAERWKEAELAARFIARLEQLPADPERAYGGRSAAEWLNWARERRDAFDPLCWEHGELWANVASVTSWEYRD